MTGTIKQLPIETLTGDLTNDARGRCPGQGQTSSSSARQLKDVDFVVADGNLYGAITPGSFTDFGPAADIYDVSTILSPDNGLANILANFSEAKAEGRETINSVDTVKITGTVTADAVNGHAPRSAPPGRPGTAWIRRTATTNWCRPSSSRLRATACR